MEEKEPIKVKLSTVLLIIAVIVIIAIVVVIGILYKKNTQKSNEINNVSNAENQMLQTEKTFSETEIKESFQNFLNLYGAMQGSPYSVLEKMKQITGKNVVNDEYPEAIEYEKGFMVPTNIKYTEFKEFMLKYMTEELFIKEFYAHGFINKNENLYCDNVSWGDGEEYEIKSIEKIKDSDTKYKVGVILTFPNDTQKIEEQLLFEVTNINNNCIISSISEIQEDHEENDIDELDDKNENVTETTTTTTTSNTTTDSNQNNNKTNTTIKYAEITKELEGIDVLYVTEVEKSNSEYTLKGVIYTEYTISKNELDNIVSKGKITLDGKEYTIKKHKDEEGESTDFIYDLSDGYTYISKKEDSNVYYLFRMTELSYVWKLTNNYRQIKVSENLIVEDDYTEERTTVKKEFSNLKNSIKAENKTNPSPAYKFEFKNGKCSKIIRATTAGR